MRLYLHIGVHRTGTTSLQKFFYNNREILTEQGVLYPLNTENHQLVAQQLITGKGGIEKTFKEILNESVKLRCDRIVISGEDFCRVKDIEKFILLAKNLDTKVICYIRRQDIWMESWYNQHVRWPWHRKYSSMTAEEFYANRGDFDWIDYHKLYLRWAEVFGKDNVIIRVFESKNLTGTLEQDFCNICDIDHSKLTPNEKVQNASTTPEALSFLRHMKLLDKPGKCRWQIIRSVNEATKKFYGDDSRYNFSAEMRQNILNEYEKSNSDLARLYFNNTNGALFDVSFGVSDADKIGKVLPTTPDIISTLVSGIICDFAKRINWNIILVTNRKKAESKKAPKNNCEKDKGRSGIDKERALQNRFLKMIRGRTLQKNSKTEVFICAGMVAGLFDDVVTVLHEWSDDNTHKEIGILFYDQVNNSSVDFKGAEAAKKISDKISEYRKEGKKKILIFNREDGCIPKELDSLELDEKSFDVKIVMFLQRQYVFIRNKYKQHIFEKNSKCERELSYDNYVKENESIYLDYGAVLDSWSDKFGESNLFVETIGNDEGINEIIKRLIRMVKIGEDTLGEELGSEEKYNMNADALEFVKYLDFNKLTKAERSIVVKQIRKVYRDRNENEELGPPEARKSLMKKYEYRNRYVSERYMKSKDGDLFGKDRNIDKIWTNPRIEIEDSERLFRDRIEPMIAGLATQLVEMQRLEKNTGKTKIPAQA